MSSPLPADAAHGEEIPLEIADLVTVLTDLPPQYMMKVGPILGRVVDSTRRRRRILSLVQSALSQLRLDMKYLVFDLEATRRERDEYRRQIDEGRQG